MILFVDDEERRTESYVDELRSAGLDVQYISDADEAWAYIEEAYAGLDLIIIDIMMPAGPRFAGLDTENGLQTGIRLYEKVRRLSATLPVAFLTNVAEDAAGLRPDPAAHYFVKRDYLSDQFPDEVRRIMRIDA